MTFFINKIRYHSSIISQVFSGILRFKKCSLIIRLGDCTKFYGNIFFCKKILYLIDQCRKLF